MISSLVKVFAVLAGIAITVAGVQTFRLDHSQDRVAEMKLAEAEANATHQRELRRVESEMIAAVDKAEAKSIQEQKDAKAIHDKLRADVLSGERKLRERFTCPRIPPSAGATPGVDGEERTGLLEEDAAFLISESHRADLIAIERNELIDIVRALRETLNERR